MGDHLVTERKVKVQLSITLSSDGSVTVHGPIHDKILCWGLLKAGELAVANHKEGKQIVAPDLIPLNKLT